MPHVVTPETPSTSYALREKNSPPLEKSTQVDPYLQLNDVPVPVSLAAAHVALERRLKGKVQIALLPQLTQPMPLAVTCPTGDPDDFPCPLILSHGITNKHSGDVFVFHAYAHRVL